MFQNDLCGMDLTDSCIESTILSTRVRSACSCVSIYLFCGDGCGNRYVFYCKFNFIAVILY